MVDTNKLQNTLNGLKLQIATYNRTPRDSRSDWRITEFTQAKSEHDKNPDIVIDHVPRINNNNTPSVIVIEHEPLIKKTSIAVEKDIKPAENKKHGTMIKTIGENTPKKENIVQTSAVITPSKIAQNTISKQTSNTEKQSANTLPQTGNEDNMSIVALGLALLSLGFGLAIKPKQDK